MNRKLMFTIAAVAASLAGCGSGDINISPATTVNNPAGNPGGGGAVNPCASYQNTGGQTIQGTVDGANCRYSPAFADAGNNVTVDLTIPALPNGGANIFEGSLFIGKDYDTDADLAAAGIAKGGDGPVLTVEPGATLAWQASANFLIINRGSQLFAVGTEDEPITFTSVSDVNGTVGPEEVSQWGGIVINGFGVTNSCAYTGSVANNDLATADCHVKAEGAAGLDASHYGGDNNDDSSGRLEYVVVKHTGAQVANGDELNGISFGAVGRNTLIKNLEMYSTYDDGIEMFGGAVNIENYVAVYARDDSIDIDSGYSGTITNALVIQSATDGNNCIESDGIADFGNLTAPQIEAVINQGINSRPTINHLTCIISPNGQGTATHEPGAGWRLREGIFPTINDSMIVGTFSAADAGSSTDNYCLRIDNRSQQGAIDGQVKLNSVIIACEEPTAGQTFTNGVTEAAFFTGRGNIFATITGATDPTAAADTDLQLLERDADGLPIDSIEYATMSVDGAVPAGSASPINGTFLGGLALSIPDWTAKWTYGIHPDNRGEPLWFE